MSLASLRKRYITGMLSGAGSVIFKTGLNIVVIPVMIAHLGLNIFGLYILLIALIEASNMLGLGLTNALTQTLGAQPPDRPAYLKAGHLLFAGLTVLLALAVLFIGPRFSHVFHISGELAPMAQVAFTLVAVEAVLSIYSCYYQAVLLAHCAHQWTNIADSLYAMITNVGALILLLCGFSLPALLAVRLSGAVLRLLLMMVQARQMEPQVLKLGLAQKDRPQKSVLTELGRLSVQGMAINFSVIISHKIDDLVIARFLPLSAVGLYEIVFRFLGITLQICLKLSEGAFPLFARLAGEQRRTDAGQLFLRMSSLLALVSGLMLMLIVVFYGELFRFFSAGRVDMNQTVPLLFIAVPCILSGVLQMPASAWLFAWGHQRFLTLSSIVAALANLALSLALVKPFGILGVALGTLIPQLIQHQGSLIRKTCRELGVSFTRYMRGVYGAILLPLLVSYGWMQLWKPALTLIVLPLDKAGPLVPIACVAASSALISGILWFWTTATPFEWDIFTEKLSHPLRIKVSRLKRWTQPSPGSASPHA